MFEGLFSIWIYVAVGQSLIWRDLFPDSYPTTHRTNHRIDAAQSARLLDNLSHWFLVGFKGILRAYNTHLIPIENILS